MLKTRLIPCTAWVASVLFSSVAVSNQQIPHFYGTDEAFAENAIYFVVTDRFVDGDPSNNHPHQGGDFPTFNQVLTSETGQTANVGYLGGDFRGILEQADYIRNMGFGALWLTPFIDNPDEAFSGGEKIVFGGQFKDGGKTGYHGYWGVNFFKEDEHYPSHDLNFQQLTTALKHKGIKTIIDIVANHGSPSFTMPIDQPKYGELYDINGKLVADHQNLAPEDLSDANPLHDFFRTTPDILQLSNLDDSNPEVIRYLTDAYLHWLAKGADAIRIDTIKHVPHAFWKTMSEIVRAKHPDIFMFAESYDYNANFIAQHTLAKNGGISVLDFPSQQSMSKVFENPDSDFSDLLDALHLTHGPYVNPYDLVTFYDNHDMKRLSGDDNSFINANNWLFTSRGIPAIYYGSEIGFMRGTKEHEGNRNYFGKENINLALTHPIHHALTRIANVRKNTPALQMGLQLNLDFSGHKAAFYRVLNTDAHAQTALVLLNKGDRKQAFSIHQFLEPGLWKEALSGQSLTIAKGQSLDSLVAPHSAQVWVREGQVADLDLVKALTVLMKHK